MTTTAIPADQPTDDFPALVARVRAELDAAKPKPPRRFYTTAQVRAEDVADGDFALIDGRWRAIYDVHTDPDAMLEVTIGGQDAAKYVKDADRVRLDTFQEGRRVSHTMHATPRPDRNGPVILTDSKVTVTVNDSDAASANMQPEAVVAALLGTDKYAALWFEREETADYGDVEAGWAIYSRWDLVTVQVETTL